MSVVFYLLEFASTLRREFSRSWASRPQVTLAFVVASVSVVLWLCWSATAAMVWPPARHMWGSVHGKVTSVSGEAVVDVTVLFIDETAGVGSSGRTDAWGNYRAYGIRAGRYAVAVRPAPLSADRPPTREDVLAAKAVLEPSVPARFQEIGSSGLTVELQRGRNRYDIDLRSPP